jgi:hypothetical protein
MSFRKVMLVLLLVLWCHLSGWAALPAQEAGKRDLSRYERGGQFNLRYFYGQEPDDEAEVLARARKLLWACWRAKRLAHFAIVKIYTHGDSTTINYYVEPDEDGRWRVAVEKESNCCTSDVIAGKERVHMIESVKSYYLVTRMDAASGRAVPDGEKRRPETYTLMLHDGKPAAQAEVGVSRTEIL